MVEQIPNITGISDDEIGNSQPISLPSSNNSNSQEMPISMHNRPPKKTGQKGNFRSIEEIDSKYRHVFSYPYFNFVQSSVIEDALYTDKSMVVCAPTGSGKTVVFEMAIVHLLMELEDINYTDDFKIIYMAPVKALCTERLTEWYPKFNKLGLLCIEVTGDTDVDFPQLKPYRIIITTPEKWDMLTRRWKDHRSLVEVIKLFLIDEVHILNDELRGPVLEAVVSRMKTIESSVQSAHRIEKLKAQYQGTDAISTSTNTSVARIRFIAVSATVSNPEDVAAWLGTKDRQAVYYKFGNESRPVKLKRVVEGYPCAEGTSIFKFDIILSYKLWPIIQKYHNGKPTLIFCNTRKSVVLTAETLSKEITVSFNSEQRMKLTALASTIKTKKIQSLVMSGIGCHHAGLLFEERMNIEHAFRNRDLPILITTTTLAMGVNLPAHLVIIKNTQQYVNGAYQEYSISTILQMVGRAGRPQFDTEATAVIMTRLQDKARYQALVGGSEPLQSYLHKRLAENLNSEAALCTVGDVAQCVQWLNSTFFSVRAARDPKRYLGLPHAAPAQLISKKIEELCVKAMNGLASAGLITMDEASCIESTEAGRLMSVYYLDLETMKLIMKLEGTESLERLLWMVCESHELSDMHLRVDERRCLNALNRNNAAATIRYPMKGKINSRQMKLNCIIQAVLGCLPIPDPSLNQEAMKIMRIADRVCKCLVSYVTRPNFFTQRPKFFTTILNSLILAKCISTRLWENSPYVSRQLKGIGPTFSALLASAGKVNFMLLEESHPRDLERIMNKGPPAGNILRKQISLLPKYNLTATPINENTVEIQLSLLNHAFLAENRENLTAGINHKSNVIVGDSENCLLYFTNFTESNLINVYDGCMTFNITRSNNNEQKIYVHCVSSCFVGIDAQCQYLFKDINITSTNIDNHQHLSLVSSKNSTQPASSDIAKIRKRKTQNDGEKTQSKEKKKRETELIAKFNVLKESFEKASKEIKVNFNETAEKSNKILENLIEPEDSSHKDSNEPEQQDLMLSSDSFQNAFQVELEYDDFVDDKQVNDILDDIEKEIKIGVNKSVDTTSCQKSPWSQNIQRYKNECKTINYNIPKNKIFNSKRSVCNKKNNYNFLYKLESNINDESDTAEIENDNGFNNAVKLKLEKYLERTNNDTKAKTNATGIIESTIRNEGEKSIECYDTDDMIINDTNERLGKCEITNTVEVLRQISESDCRNKDKIALENRSPRHEKDTITENFITSNKGEIVTHEFKLPLLENNASNNDEENDGNKIVTVASNEKNNNICNIAPNILIINDKNLMKTPEFGTLKSISTTKTKSVADSNDLENFNHCVGTQWLKLSHNNYVESILPLLENKCFGAYNNDNHLKTNLNNTVLTNRNTSKYNMKYHSLNKTNYFNTTIENANKEKVRLIGKLEINLNLAEIVSSNNDNSEVNTEKQNAKIEEDSGSTSIYNTDVNKLQFTTNKNIMQICNTTYKRYNGNLSLDTKDENADFEDTMDKENKLPKTTQTVNDILQKYNHIVKKRTQNDIQNEQAMSNEDKNVEINSAGRDMKLKRKYKIRDLENLEIDLPESLIARHEEPATLMSRDIIGNASKRNNNDADDVFQNNICNIKHEIDDLENNMLPKFMIEELTDSDLNLEVSETILNPKMLLQCVSEGNDEEDIIPPPPEFRDYDETSSNSSIHEAKINVEYDILESQDYANENDPRENICFERSEIDLSPSREVHKLANSPNTRDLIFYPTMSYTAIDKNIIESKNTSSFFKTRSVKLSEFKFKRKNIFRK